MTEDARDARAAAVPLVDYLVLDDGEPHLVANVCTVCGALYFDRRNACANCESESFQRMPQPTEGVLRSFSIVGRAALGVPVPFVSAVVDLDGGARVKANLHRTTFDPVGIPLNGRVRLMTFVAGVDDDGTEAIAFGFEPV